MPLMILPFVIILLSLFNLFRNRSRRSMKESQDAFWEKQHDKLSEFEQTLHTLSSRKILNLSGISNTDLKLQYGAANLPVLSDCDTQFTTLARTLSAYGEQLAALGHWQDAVHVLEFGVACKTDISKNYTLLGTLYHEHNQTDKLNELIEIVRSSDMLLKNTVLKQLTS